MQTEDTRLASGGHDLEKRMTRARGIMPLVIIDLFAAEITDRMVSTRGPKRKLRGFSETFNDLRMSRFLKDDEVRRRSYDRRCKCLFASEAAEANVVAEHLQVTHRHRLEQQRSKAHQTKRLDHTARGSTWPENSLDARSVFAATRAMDSDSARYPDLCRTTV